MKMIDAGESAVLVISVSLLIQVVEATDNMKLGIRMRMPQSQDAYRNSVHTTYVRLKRFIFMLRNTSSYSSSKFSCIIYITQDAIVMTQICVGMMSSTRTNLRAASFSRMELRMEAGPKFAATAMQ